MLVLMQCCKCAVGMHCIAIEMQVQRVVTVPECATVLSVMACATLHLLRISVLLVCRPFLMT